MEQKEMQYCLFCGTKLQIRELEGEGMIPFCEKCGEYRFPVFNTAVSMIVTNTDRDKILLIKQYGRDRYILVAGYVNKGEDAEDAVCREIREEMGLRVVEYSFNRSHYFKPSSTLMLNFTAVVEDSEPHPNREIDSYQWFSLKEARDSICKGSLAESFLLGYLDGQYHFR
ncbi:MAG: NUDIX domain-containing protein [Lachnospiraceae bacterium]|nr:NUDIX domain-containing protein [Lachnospiraceae bacterium]